MPNPFTEAQGILKAMERDFSRENLGSTFKSRLDIYVPSLSESNQAPLNTPMPNASIISKPPTQIAGLSNGLTPIENALLNESEKQMRLKQRGLA